jgi:cell wall-associated NlpC family hydrolase
MLVRDGARRLGPVLGAVAALGVAAAFVGEPGAPHAPAARGSAAHGLAAHGSAALGSGDGVSLDAAYAESAPGRSVPGTSVSAGGSAAGGSVAAAVSFPAASGVPAPARPGAASRAVQVAKTLAASTPAVAPLGKLRPADLLVVAPTSLPPAVVRAVRRLPGVTAAEGVDAATIKVDGKFIQMLGVSPDSFRAFAAGPTARSTPLWRGVAGGDIAVSDTMGKQDNIPLGSAVRVAGQRPETLRVGGYGTVGITGVDAVVSEAVARSLGLPAGNALVISAPHARLATLTKRIKALLPHGAGVAQLVVQAAPAGAEPGVAAAQAAEAGSAGATSPTADDGSTMTLAQVQAFLKAALSRVGMPYVWGAAGPTAFDCSGLVQWSMRQAGIVMPRVADDQARTGPRVALSQLRPGDLLFYHTDATAPTYISHVAIYIGNGNMVQAPEPGMDVQIVKADFGPAFAGAVQVYPQLAAAVAGDLAG